MVWEVRVGRKHFDQTCHDFTNTSNLFSQKLASSQFITFSLLTFFEFVYFSDYSIDFITDASVVALEGSTFEITCDSLEVFEGVRNDVSTSDVGKGIYLYLYQSHILRLSDFSTGYVFFRGSNSNLCKEFLLSIQEGIEFGKLLINV